MTTKKISKTTQKKSKTSSKTPKETNGEVKIVTPEGHQFALDLSNIHDVCVEEIDFDSLEYEEESPGLYRIEAMGKIVFRGVKATKVPKTR